MSYDLDFWRYKAGVKLDHQDVYERLVDGERVEGVETLPIDAILRRIEVVFSDWQKLDAMTFDGGERGGFQLFATPQCFGVDCHDLSDDEMNKFIDIGVEFGCSLYDPQVGRRFDDG
jgi:hypothetical protein